ncbi:MAG: Asp-tRNA(Asn)/Glu-tRNA(Gln) amidotransferase subunit GatB [Cyanobacteriota bacterium]
MSTLLKQKYETVIGLEIHAHLKTKSKIFCNCPTDFGCPPNDNVCPVCMGLPGVLPVLNQKVVDFAILAALALKCTVSKKMKFDRKQYFYPDLPKNYQISQYDMPVATNGRINISGKNIRINRIHLEEDAGKLVHAGSDGLAGSTYSLVDYNRTGVPLIEIVSEADLRSAEEARIFMSELRNILRYLGICDGNLEEGSLRCDANISVRPYGQEKFGTKVEVKNMNSFKALQKALEHEESRLMELSELGEEIVQETRLWNDETGTTSSMRTKEYAHDYRYFPEPDLLPYLINEDYVNKLKEQMPELPEAKRTRYQQKLGLSEYDANVIVDSQDISLFFDKIVNMEVNAKAAANWLMGDITYYLKENKINLEQTKLTPESLFEMISMIDNNKISNNIGKKVLIELIEKGGSPSKIVEKMGLSLITDENELEQLVKQVLTDNPQQVEKYKAGKTGLIGFFVGQIMKTTKGKAEPKLVNDLLKKELDN